jgi:hypothetical protein
MSVDAKQPRGEVCSHDVLILSFIKVIFYALLGDTGAELWEGPASFSS